jgi:pimeloyl-ACP methyl ester carboxylesterase
MARSRSPEREPHGRSRRRFAVSLTALAACALIGAVMAQAAPAAGKAPRVAVQGVPAAGPAKYDRLWVRKYGPKDAQCVLVLSPGSPAGQGGYRKIAPAIANRVDGLAVWTIDRRPNALEDVSVFKRDRPRQSLGYYLLGQRVGGQLFKPVTTSQAGFVRKWGGATTLGDVRNVVQKASDGGKRCVILGGHSYGTLITEAYLAWDFNGTPGYQGLSGIVLIDGGLFNAFENVLAPAGYPTFENVGEARAAVNKLQHSSPFGSDGSIPGLPSWVPGVVPEIVCQYALKHPNAVSGLQKSTIGTRFLPGVKFSVTNEAFAGLFFEATAADDAARMGHLAKHGNPRGWRDGRYSSVSRWCSTFTQEPGNGLEWYFPQRLMIDIAQGMEPLERNAITDYLGTRPFHLAEIDLPLYVIQTKLSEGGVLRSAHKFIRRSRITDYTLVNEPKADHSDPLVDYPKHNKFLKTVVPFLRDTIHGAGG